MNIKICFRDLIHLIKLSEYDVEEIRMFTSLPMSLREYFSENLIHWGTTDKSKYFKYKGNIFELPSIFYDKNILNAADEHYILALVKVLHVILPTEFYNAFIDEISYCSESDSTIVRFSMCWSMDEIDVLFNKFKDEESFINEEDF